MKVWAREEVCLGPQESAVVGRHGRTCSPISTLFGWTSGVHESVAGRRWEEG